MESKDSYCKGMSVHYQKLLHYLVPDMTPK
nr:MAG TPA: hypothetical protein [Caudoviricetes sp.]